MSDLHFGGAEILLIFGVLAIFLFLSAIPAILAFVVLSRVPPEHRQQTPGLAFLLMIPIFNLIWMFFVHPKVAESLQRYFIVKGDASVGDCGAQLALWMCILSVCGLIPFLGIFAGVASLVLMILFYVKAFDLSSRIVRAA